MSPGRRSFSCLHPVTWTVRRKLAPISNGKSRSHTSYRGCEMPLRREHESTIALPLLSSGNLTSVPRSVADCVPTKLQLRCRGIRHEDAENRASVPGLPVLPCRQTWIRPRLWASAASRDAASETVASQACSGKHRKRRCTIASLSQGLLSALRRHTKRTPTTMRPVPRRLSTSRVRKQKRLTLAEGSFLQAPALLSRFESFAEPPCEAALPEKLGSDAVTILEYGHLGQKYACR